MGQIFTESGIFGAGVATPSGDNSCPPAFPLFVILQVLQSYIYDYKAIRRHLSYTPFVRLFKIR